MYITNSNTQPIYIHAHMYLYRYMYCTSLSQLITKCVAMCISSLLQYNSLHIHTLRYVYMYVYYSCSKLQACSHECIFTKTHLYLCYYEVNKVIDLIGDGAFKFMIIIRRHDSDVYLGMSLVQNGGSYLMY